MEEWIEEVESTGTADVVEALRMCAEQLGRMSSLSYLQAGENAAGDSVTAVDKERAEARRLLVSLFGEPEGKGAVTLTLGNVPLAEVK